MVRPCADDVALGDEERATSAFLFARDDDAEGHVPEAAHASDLSGDLFERFDPVPEPGGVLEPQIAGKPAELCAQLRQRVVECLPLDALQGARSELCLAPALDRA